MESLVCHTCADELPTSKEEMESTSIRHIHFVKTCNRCGDELEESRGAWIADIPEQNSEHTTIPWELALGIIAFFVYSLIGIGIGLGTLM